MERYHFFRLTPGDTARHIIALEFRSDDDAMDYAQRLLTRPGQIQVDNAHGNVGTAARLSWAP